MWNPGEIAPEMVRPLSRREYGQMASLGMFEGERVELLYGTVVRMSPKGPAHESTLERLAERFMRAVVPRASVRIQSAFAATGGSQPEPDLAIVPRRRYDDAHPDQAFLIIEVADTSGERDRGVKARLYAEAGVPEYSVVDLRTRTVERHRSPQDGEYADLTTHDESAVLQPEHFPDVTIPIREILPR